MIEVQLLNGVGYVWKLEDVETLREKHRIVGSFVGFAPKTFNVGLPQILASEEIQVLHDDGIISLYEVDESSLFSPEVLSRALTHKEQTYQEQIEAFKEDKIQVFS